MDPYLVFLETVLTTYAADAHDIVERIIHIAASGDEDVPIQEGFELYKEMVEISRKQAEALPELVVITLQAH